MPEKNTENSISAHAARALIAAHDGDMALLYIYALSRGAYTPEDAARELCRTMAEIQAAEEKLGRIGLLPLGKAIAAPTEAAPAAPGPSPAASVPAAAKPSLPEAPEEKLPEYRASDIVRRSKEDGAFSVILTEAAKVIGHNLSSNDMKMLFGIYDYLAIPPEVILELLNYCAELFADKYGSGRRPSARAIEKEAYTWANKEILTLEQAEAFIRSQKERRSRLAKIKLLLGITDRRLSPGENKYICSWIDMGFEDEAISIAYDRTVTAIGSLKWAYMNRIICSWHENGLHSAAEIREKDERRPKPSVHSQSSQGTQSVDMDELRRTFEKI